MLHLAAKIAFFGKESAKSARTPSKGRRLGQANYDRNILTHLVWKVKQKNSQKAAWELRKRQFFPFCGTTKEPKASTFLKKHRFVYIQKPKYVIVIYIFSPHIPCFS